ncbi:MAG: hypothetical protein R3283_11535, partial [Balneolaceae bacterium]|nr:hypothetical protein [Balneolaceae bacterium]
MNQNTITTQSLLYLTGVTAILLAIPFIAMQITNDVQWTASDFVIAGAMLFFSGLAWLFLKSRKRNTLYKIASAILVGSVLFLLWSNLAVGIIGSESNTINIYYFGIVLVAVLGSAFASLQPTGMSLTLFVMAFIQLLITVAALMTGMHNQPGSSLTEIVGINT